MTTPTPTTNAHSAGTLTDNVADAAANTVQNAGKVYDAAQEGAEQTLAAADDKEGNVLSAVSKIQQKIGSQLTPVPENFEAISLPSELKARLDWGEPALSIVDVRDRESFNNERIVGAMPMPIDTLATAAKAAFEADRDIFIYSDSDMATAEAVTQLQSSGFKRVTSIKGGLPAWKAINGATEGRGASPESTSLINQTATP